MRPKCSLKSYAVAVSLSAIFGFVGIHHFYLGRHLEGLADVWMTAAWVYYLLIDWSPWLGFTILAVDLIHTFVVSLMLLTGSFKDGDGRIICYPGQEMH